MFVSPTGTFDNGAEISIYHLMSYLQKNGYKVVNVAPKSTMNNQTDYMKRFSDIGIDVHLIPTIKWWWEDAPGGIAGLPEQRAASFRDSINQIIHIINAYHVDFVITNTVNMYEGMVAAACTEIPHYTLIHEFPEGEFAYYLDKIDFVEENSDRIFSVDGQLKNVLTQKFVNSDVGGFTPYTELKTSVLKKGNQHRIVSVGRLTERKNQLELLYAFQKLTSNSMYKDIELVFIGPWDSEYKKLCDSYINEYNLRNIIFCGEQKNPWSLVTDKDICVFPSALETYGLVYVESILNGIPTIFSDNPGHLSAYQRFEFGTLYPLGNIDVLVNSIENQLNHFDEEKKAAEEYMLVGRERYQIKNVYSEIIKEIEMPQKVKLKSIRHLQNLLSLNEGKSKLARLETKVRVGLQKLKNRKR